MDWLAALLIILSIYMTGNLNKWGWIIAILGAIMYMIVSIQKHIYGFVFLDCVLVVLHIVNFIKWSKNEKKNL